MPASKSTTLSAASVSEAVCCVFTLFADPEIPLFLLYHNCLLFFFLFPLLLCKASPFVLTTESCSVLCTLIKEKDCQICVLTNNLLYICCCIMHEWQRQKQIQFQVLFIFPTCQNPIVNAENIER